MRLTLIHPSIGKKRNQKQYIKTWLMEPLAPATIAGLTPKDVEIKFYDDRLEEVPYDEPTDLVAMSVETYTAKRAYQIASEYRKKNVPVIMGGFHATLIPEEVIEYAESIVVGEAENIWGELIEDFKTGNLQKFYVQEGRADLSKTSPDRSIFQRKNYLQIGLVEAARGCRFTCDFCAIQTFFKNTQAARPIESIIREIKEIQKDLIFFVDDNLVSNPVWTKEFLKALVPQKIRWVGQASINVAFDKEILHLLKESGCFGLLIGFETLNTKNLRTMNKLFNTMSGGFVEAVKNLRSYGIRLYPTFIFGYPEDDLNCFRETVDFAKKQKFLITSFNHLTPFPGTPLYKRLENENKLIYEKWWLDDKYSYGEAPLKIDFLTPEQIKENCIHIRKSFYSMPSIVKRAFDRVNCNDSFSLKTFFILNMMFRKEVSEREGYPLGDESYQGSLLKARHSDTRTYAEWLQGSYKNKNVMEVVVKS